MSSHPGRSIIVTGAARGIGQASARLFATEGGRVLLVDVDPRVDAACQDLRRDGLVARSIVADVSQALDIDRVGTAMLEWTGKVDVLVNNAAVHQRFGSLDDVDEQSWDRTMSVNVRSMYLLSRRVAPSLIESGGTIVNVSSIVGAIIGSTVSLPYATSKAAIVGLTRSLALELGPKGVRVNCVCPGPIDTDLTRNSFKALSEKTGSGEHQAAVLRATVPLRRFGEAAEVAATISFLASSAASFVTGAALVVDGGLSIG